MSTVKWRYTFYNVFLTSVLSRVKLSPKLLEKLFLTSPPPPPPPDIAPPPPGEPVSLVTPGTS